MQTAVENNTRKIVLLRRSQQFRFIVNWILILSPVCDTSNEMLACKHHRLFPCASVHLTETFKSKWLFHNTTFAFMATHISLNL